MGGARHARTATRRGASAGGQPAAAGAQGARYLRSPLDTGTAAGEWFTSSPTPNWRAISAPTMPGRSSVEGAVLDDEFVILGRPVLTYPAGKRRPLANLAARLVDVHPDGTATRVSFGVLNLAHRNGNAQPEPLTPGEDHACAVELDACGYRFAPGHRIRLSISTAYWPTILPPPFDAKLDIDLSALALSLPLIGAHERIDLPAPPNPDPLPKYEPVSPGESRRWVERDLQNGVTRYRIVDDGGLNRHPENGLASRDRRDETWTIAANDPLSMTGETRWTCVLSREGWETVTHCVSTIACDEGHWLISDSVDASHDGETVFSRRRERRIPRDHM